MHRAKAASVGRERHASWKLGHRGRARTHLSLRRIGEHGRRAVDPDHVRIGEVPLARLRAYRWPEAALRPLDERWRSDPEHRARRRARELIERERVVAEPMRELPQFVLAGIRDRRGVQRRHGEAIRKRQLQRERGQRDAANAANGVVAPPQHPDLAMMRHECRDLVVVRIRQHQVALADPLESRPQQHLPENAFQECALLAPPAGHAHDVAVPGEQRDEPGVHE